MSDRYSRRWRKDEAIPSWCAPSDLPMPHSLKEALETHPLREYAESYVLPKLFDHRLEKLDELARSYLNKGEWEQVDLLRWDEIPPRSPYKFFYIWCSEVWNDWRDQPWEYGFIIPSRAVQPFKTVADLRKLVASLSDNCTIDFENLDPEEGWNLYEINGCQHLTTEGWTSGFRSGNKEKGVRI